MNKINSKLIIIPIFILFILLLLYFAFAFGKKTPQRNPNPTFSPSPTTNKLQGKKITPLPTLIPAAFTGAAENPEIAPEEMDLATQKYILRKKTPFKQSNFSIFFDYSTDMFNVILQEPKNVTQASFSAWLSNNYSSLPINRFIIK